MRHYIRQINTMHKSIASSPIAINMNLCWAERFQTATFLYVVKQFQKTKNYYRKLYIDISLTTNLKRVSGRIDPETCRT